MVVRSKLGPKARRYFQTKRDPLGSFSEQLREISRGTEEVAQQKAREIVGKKESEIFEHIESAKKKAIGTFNEALEQLMRIFRKKVEDELPFVKGDAGYTPVKGLDYFDGEKGEDGADGITPKPDVDYPSMRSISSMIESARENIFIRLKSVFVPKDDFADAIISAVKKMDFSVIARGLEGLKEKDRLDYWNGLKNQPVYNHGEKAGGVHTLHRGGPSKQTYEYDLSDQCDGVTKSFTIPANSRVVLVQSTDAPSGILRKTVDWTGSGSTTLQLTAAVVAPAQGATLSLLYVV